MRQSGLRRGIATCVDKRKMVCMEAGATCQHLIFVKALTQTLAPYGIAWLCVKYPSDVRQTGCTVTLKLENLGWFDSVCHGQKAMAWSWTCWEVRSFIHIRAMLTVVKAMLPCLRYPTRLLVAHSNGICRCDSIPSCHWSKVAWCHIMWTCLPVWYARSLAEHCTSDNMIVHLLMIAFVSVFKDSVCWSSMQGKSGMNLSGPASPRVSLLRLSTVWWVSYPFVRAGQTLNAPMVVHPLVKRLVEGSNLVFVCTIESGSTVSKRHGALQHNSPGYVVTLSTRFTWPMR